MSDVSATRRLLELVGRVVDEAIESVESAVSTFRANTQRLSGVVPLRSVDVVESFHPYVTREGSAFEEVETLHGKRVRGLNEVAGGGIFGDLPRLDMDGPAMPRTFHAGDGHVAKIELIHGRYVEVTFDSGFVKGFSMAKVESWAR